MPTLPQFEDFRRARDAIARGFTKHALWNNKNPDTPKMKWQEVVAQEKPEVSFCIQGALLFAGFNNNPETTQRAWIDALCAALPEKYKASSAYRALRLVDFNNAPETTQADVVALFDRVIANVDW